MLVAYAPGGAKGQSKVSKYRKKVLQVASVSVAGNLLFLTRAEETKVP